MKIGREYFEDKWETKDGKLTRSKWALECLNDWLSENFVSKIIKIESERIEGGYMTPSKEIITIYYIEKCVM